MSWFLKIKSAFFYWSLAMVLVSLPFPKYNLNSISIIVLMFFWLFQNSLYEKFKNLKKHFPLFLLLSSIFWLSLIGLLYSENMKEGLRNLQQNLPFLLLPLVFLSVNLNEKFKETALKFFSYSVVISSLFALSKALYFKVNNLGDYFFFDQLAILLDRHTTYFALFILVAISYFLQGLLRSNFKGNKLPLLSIIFLLIMLYMVSARISVIGLVSVLIMYLLSYRRKISVGKFVLILIPVLLLFFVYAAPNFQKRFNSETPEGVEISDMGSRIIHWEAVISRIQQDNLLVGSGTGDGHLGLYEEYRKFDFETGYRYQYNAHNQYLETVLFFGIAGLILLLLTFYVLFKTNWKSRDPLGISIGVLFFIFMITESILERQSGIVLFAYLVSLLIVSNFETKQINSLNNAI